MAQLLGALHTGDPLIAEAALESAIWRPIKALHRLVRSRAWNVAFMHALCDSFRAHIDEGCDLMGECDKLLPSLRRTAKKKESRWCPSC